MKVDWWEEIPELAEAISLVNNKTGEVVGTKAEYNKLTFTLSTSPITGAQQHTVTGSIHCYHNKGGDNSNQFSIQDLSVAIDDLAERFGIDPTSALIQTLEIGVNLSLPYSPTKVIRSMVVCSNKPYSRQIDEKEPGQGLVWTFDDHEVKIYDKGNLSGCAPKNLLRVEVKARKKRFLKKYNVWTLDDLRNPTNLIPLVDKLLEVIDRIVFIDPIPPRLDLLIDTERADFYRFRDPYTWIRKGRAPVQQGSSLTTWQRQDCRERLTYLLDKCEALDYKKDLKQRILAEWYILAGQPQPSYAPTAIEAVVEIESCTGEAHEVATFTPLGYVGVNVVPTQKEVPITQAANSILESSPDLSASPVVYLSPDRVCVACGKELTGQLSTSRYCSEKYNGKTAARQCRNRISNRRRSIKNQILKAQRQDQYIRVHHCVNGLQRTDVLHSSALSLTSTSLDKIISLSILKDKKRNILYSP